ncbi:unnamed protein product [Boreogadus saida]
MTSTLWFMLLLHTCPIRTSTDGGGADLTPGAARRRVLRPLAGRGPSRCGGKCFSDRQIGAQRAEDKLISSRISPSSGYSWPPASQLRPSGAGLREGQASL